MKITFLTWAIQKIFDGFSILKKSKVDDFKVILMSDMEIHF